MFAGRRARAVAVLYYAVIVARENAHVVVAGYIGVRYADIADGSLVSAEQRGDFGDQFGFVARVVYEQVGYGVVVAVEGRGE